MSFIELYNDDCIERMKKLIDENIIVDSVITDIPYGTTQCSWDSVIPFEDMWNCLHSICPMGPVVLFAKQPFTSNLIMSNLKEFKESIVWLKNKAGTGFRATQKHISVTEDIIVFSKENNYTYNPQKWLVASKEFMTQRKTFDEVEVGNNIYNKIKRVRKEDTGERNPINIVSCRVPFTPSNDKEYSDEIDLRYHPTQKPLDLMEYLVKTFSNENDVVLDFTMGSGTTGVACKKLNRSFIGIEKDEKYFKIAEKRING